MNAAFRAEKVHVVMNLPDDAVFRRLSRPERSPGQALRLLYHGTMSHRYGVDVLLDAVDQARREIPVTLTVHGQGEYLAELHDQARRLGLDEVVTFSDRFLPTNELPALWKPLTSVWCRTATTSSRMRSCPPSYSSMLPPVCR